MNGKRNSVFGCGMSYAGKWKTTLTQTGANSENVGETLLEWAWEQLQVAGSIERLLKFSIKSGRKANGPSENKRELQDKNRGPGQFAGAGRSGASNPEQPV